MKSLEEVRQELDKFMDTKCERCNKILKNNHYVTEAIYCYKCHGIYCLECWFEQRAKEDKK